jgi:hypothetical protein
MNQEEIRFGEFVLNRFRILPAVKLSVAKAAEKTIPLDAKH